MRGEKSNFAVYSLPTKTSNVPRATNIVDLIKKSKEQEKKEKILKIYTLVGFAGLVLFFGGIIFI
tara:strand:- start:248 stop:442 length:195 start_codon:yes stop_codon:yes gene_type:complete